MLDLENILNQVAGTDINVYTHGEMLPAHMYPKLREHPNLAGHYGGAWQKQKHEFEEFGGPIVGTTNCVLIPLESNTYLPRFFTTRATAVPGATRIKDDDYSQVIAKAVECGSLPEKKHAESQVGFHWSFILSMADKVVDAVKTGQINHFFVIGGCDGAEPGRNYFSDFAQGTPQDSLILTLGCGKYRIRDHDYGTVAGIPRLLDVGQCNDAYGAIRIALALSEAFGCGVNDLPLNLVISWFEQKAVAVFLTLLHLGVKGIRLGPALPAFITPNILNVLVEQYDVKPIGQSAKADLEEIYAAKN
jgi:hydroxylamine reductase